MNTSTSIHEQETSEQQAPVELAVLLQQEAILREDARHSQWRTLFMLFASTFLLMYWFSTISQMKMDSLRFRPYLLMPGMMNLVAWLTWGMEAYLNLLSITRRLRRGPQIGTLQVREVLDGYQYTGFVLRRQIWRERLVATCITLQIVIMTAVAWMVWLGNRDLGANF